MYVGMYKEKEFSRMKIGKIFHSINHIKSSRKENFSEQHFTRFLLQMQNCRTVLNEISIATAIYQAIKASGTFMISRNSLLFESSTGKPAEHVKKVAASSEDKIFEKKLIKRVKSLNKK